MTVPARIGIVTLGVSDLARSIEFYEALGWERCGSSVEGVICWFRTADSYLGLFPYEELAADAAVASPGRGTFDGVTLAINVATQAEVSAALEAAGGGRGHHPQARHRSGVRHLRILRRSRRLSLGGGLQPGVSRGRTGKADHSLRTGARRGM